MRLYKLGIFLLCTLGFSVLFAQNYQAINGSSYAGSLSAQNNPASIVQVPFSWDITPFAVQTKQATNAFVINNFSLLSPSSNAKLVGKNGTAKRFVFTNQNIRLLNTRINLNNVAAIAFGVNIRSYVYATTSQVNWQDTTQRLQDFMKINSARLPLSGESRGSAWAELYGTYARTIYSDDRRILTAGLTLKINRALAGEYVSATGLNYIPAGNTAGYQVTGGNVQYGYSSNFDEIDSNRSASANRKSFFQHTMAGISADAGLEYTLLDDEAGEEGNDFTYRTKIGISLMDVGRNKFRYSSRSSNAAGIKPNMSDTAVSNAFFNINSTDDFNNGLKTVAASFTSLAGLFNIYQPARVILNVDQHLANNFYLNGELTVPVFPLVPKQIRYIKDMNLVAVTPRWETKTWGAYLPLQLNNQKQLWLGAAFKAGPLLLGSHNLANIVSKNKIQSGGFYLALTIRPGKNRDGSEGGSAERGSRRSRQSLECPKL